jgi:molybdenum cofactor biosynthesis enzyme MoaA
MFNNFESTDAKVYPTYQCEGKCPFCLTEVRPKTNEVETSEFLANFSAEIKTYFKNGGKKVLFTGGEPTQAIEKLLGMLQILAQYQFELVVLYTNGAKLLEKIEYQGETKTILEFLYQFGLRHINMSVHHYLPAKRIAISDYIGHCDTEKIINQVQKIGIELRLNCTLLKDYIGNATKVRNYIYWANSLGVKDVYFRDLFHVNNRGERTTPGDQKKLEYSDQQRINFTELIDELRASDDFIFVEELSRHQDWGQTYIFRHQPTDSQVSFGTLTIGSESEDEVTYFTVNPNGKMTPNMNQSEYTENTR